MMEYMGTYEEHVLDLPQQDISRLGEALKCYITHGIMPPGCAPSVDPDFIKSGTYASNGRGWVHRGTRYETVNDERVEVVVFEIFQNGRYNTLRINENTGLRRVTPETLTEIIEAHPFVQGKVIEKKEKVNVTPG